MDIFHNPVISIKGVPYAEQEQIEYEIKKFSKEFESKFRGKPITEVTYQEMKHEFHDFMVWLQQRYEWKIKPSYDLIIRIEDVDRSMFAGNVLSEQKEIDDGLKNFVKTLKDHSITTSYNFENLQKNSMRLSYDKECHMIIYNEKISKCAIPRYLPHINEIRLETNVINNKVKLTIWYWDWMDEMESFTIETINDVDYYFDYGSPYEHEDDFIRDLEKGE